MPRLKKLTQLKNLEFYSAEISTALKIPLVDSKVSAGFPSPAEDYTELKLDIVKLMIKHPSATFFVRVTGTSMTEAGIQDGDLLVVDRSIEATNNCIAVCHFNGEFTVKRLHKTGKKIFLKPANPDYKPIEIKEGSEFEIWGVVSYVIHKA